MITHKRLFSWLSRFKPGIRFRYKKDPLHQEVDQYWYKVRSFPSSYRVHSRRQYVVNCGDVTWIIAFCNSKNKIIIPKEDIIFKDDNL